MPQLKQVTPNGMLQAINQNFEELAPLGGMIGLGNLRVARFVFDAAVIANRPIGPHGTGVFVPANAIVCGGFVEVNTAMTGDANATLAISIKAANDIITAATVGGAPYSTIGIKAIVPKANTPESTGIKLTVAKEIVCTVAVAALLTGKLNGYIFFLEGDASA